MTNLKYYNILLFISMLYYFYKNCREFSKMSQIIFSPEQLQFINKIFAKSEEKIW